MALKDKFSKKQKAVPVVGAAAQSAESAKAAAAAADDAAKAGGVVPNAFAGAKPAAKAAAAQAQPAAKAAPKGSAQAQPSSKSAATTAKLAPMAAEAGKSGGFTPVHQAGPAGQTAPAKAAPRGVAEAAARRSVGIRRVKMTIQKIEPLSILKIGFLLSVAMGIMIVIAMLVLWLVLDAMHVFAQVNDLFETLNSEQLLQIAAYLGFGRWMSFAVIIAIIDIVLFTALSAVGALVYNLVAALVGGLHITVTDE